MTRVQPPLILNIHLSVADPDRFHGFHGQEHTGDQLTIASNSA